MDLKPFMRQARYAASQRATLKNDSAVSEGRIYLTKILAPLLDKNFEAGV